MQPIRRFLIKENIDMFINKVRVLQNMDLIGETVCSLEDIKMYKNGALLPFKDYVEMLTKYGAVSDKKKQYQTLSLRGLSDIQTSIDNINLGGYKLPKHIIPFYKSGNSGYLCFDTKKNPGKYGCINYYSPAKGVILPTEGIPFLLADSVKKHFKISTFMHLLVIIYEYKTFPILNDD